MSDRKWYHNGPQNGLSVPVYSTDGHILHAATSESADAFVSELNQLEQRVSDLKCELECEKIIHVKRLVELATQ